MIRVSTFNVENLFARYRFRQNVDPVELDGFTINNLAFDINDETEKRITAQVIKEVNADVIALQEVESLPVLDRFNSRYLAGKNYKYRMLVDSFDPRHIDVAVLSRYPITSVKSHREERNSENTGFLFSRDCLEVGIEVNNELLVLYINHFKSMMYGRSDTKPRREEQVKRVAEIITEDWEPKGYSGNFIVLGDFNDYVDGDTSLNSLIKHPGLVNVSDRIPVENRWTHYWAGGNQYKQLDFILLSKSLSEGNNNKPEIVRIGLPYRAELYQGERLDAVGESNPKASDHCPIYMDLNIG